MSIQHMLVWVCVSEIAVACNARTGVTWQMSKTAALLSFFCLWQCFRFYFYYFFFCIYSPRSPCQLTIYITAACRWNCHRLRGDKIDMQNYKICGKVEGKGENIRKTVQKIGKCNGNTKWIILEELNDDIESAARWNDWKSPPIVIHCW